MAGEGSICTGTEKLYKRRIYQELKNLRIWSRLKGTRHLLCPVLSQAGAAAFLRECVKEDSDTHERCDREEP